ncbi:MAG: M28 family peptidase, partial [Gemmatimonadota bacterium]
GLGWLALMLAPLLVLAAVPAWAAAALWIGGLGALACLAAGVGLGWTTFGGVSREDANLIARRPGAVVTRWIVAHADTKAQGHSMAGRIVAVWAVLVALTIATLAALYRAGGVIPAPAVVAVVLVAIVAGGLAARGRLRGRSAGARDNGSGLLAALVAAETAIDGTTGILITGAEEFGLVGARIIARVTPELLRGTEVVNVDTVDDAGLLYLVSHDPSGAALAERLRPALERLGPPVRRRRVPLGVFVDSHPLSRAGVPAITIGRLNWATLRRLHTARDTADGLSLDMADAVGRAIASAN